jgi:uncharacterized protein (TIGR02611 family)
MKRLLVRGSSVVIHTTVGVVLLVAGAVMLVTPGPGIVTIVLGLAVLAREFDWAERLQRAALHRVHDASTRARARLAAHRAARAVGVEDLQAAAQDPGPDVAGPEPGAEERVRPAS